MPEMNHMGSHLNRAHTSNCGSWREEFTGNEQRPDMESKMATLEPLT